MSSVHHAGACGSGATSNADAKGLRGRFQLSCDIFPLPRFASRVPPCMAPRTSHCNETIDSLIWLAAFKGPSAQLVSLSVVRDVGFAR